MQRLDLHFILYPSGVGAAHPKPEGFLICTIMAEGKKSFILYADLIHTVELLDNDLAGKLFKHILSYVNDGDPQTNDLMLKLVFEPIKHQLKRDLKEWESIREKRAESGRAGGIKSGEARKQTKQVLQNRSKTKQTQANEAVTVNVNDNVTVNDNVNDFISIKRNFFNDFRWKEKFCNDKGLQMLHLEEKMQEFISDIELREDWKELKELKSHFTNLFNKQKNGLKPTETSGRHRGGLQLVASLKQDFASGGKKDTGT